MLSSIVDHTVVQRQAHISPMTLSSTRVCPVIVVIGEMGDEGRPPGLDRVADRVVFRFANTSTGLESALPGAEGALVWDFQSRYLRESLYYADSLRWIHVAAAGVDAVMSPELAASDIVLTNARGVFNRSIAETVAAMILVFAKDMLTTIDLQRKRVWRHRETEMVAGQRALIVGTGDIGRETARTLRALDIDVVGVATTERSDPDFGMIRSIDDLDDLLPTADFLVLVVPLTHRTRGLLGPKQFSLMKQTARLINVGRGELVDDAALVGALRSGEIAGAALDVFHDEPLPPDHPDWAMSQVLVSPHMSADFCGRLEALADQFMDNLVRWLDGEPLVNVVDKQQG